MDLLQDQWSPAGGVLSILLSVRSLLSSPTVDDAESMPANVAAAHAFLQQPQAYREQNEAIAVRLPSW